MITLKTLDQASAQEVFDQVAEHLLTQNRKSFDMKYPDMCAYRGQDDLKCAAGCLIADDEYNKEMEGCSWDDFSMHSPKKHFDLICKLQNIHDFHEPYEWKEKLKELARMKRLNMKEINKL